LAKSDIHKQCPAESDEPDYLAALSQIRRRLRSHDTDGKAWNDAGLLLCKLARPAEAITCFQRARETEYDTARVNPNLLLAYLAEGCTGQAVELLEEMCCAGELRVETVTEAVSFLMETGDRSQAVEIALAASRRLDDGRLEELLADIRAQRPRIAFFCGGDGDTFLKDIYEFVAGRFETRLFEGNTVQELRRLMDWSDISWFEWCTELAQIGSHLPKVCQNIVRLHRYEAYLDWPRRVNWANIDMLITVGNRYVDEALSRQVPHLKTQTRVLTIPNGVNLAMTPFVRRRRGKNIAFVGSLRMVKNPMFLLQCMKKLCETDPEYRLFIAGETPDILVEQYFRHMVEALGLGGNVILEGWQADVGSWLADKHYIVLTSVIESQGMGMLEGMAQGLKGVIHNFPGAEDIYPKELLFNTADDFCRVITSGSYDPGAYRRFVEQRYSLKDRLRQINEILKGFEGACRPKARHRAEVGAGV